MRRSRQARMLTEFHERTGDYNTGGVTGRKLMTAYRERALRCAWALQQNGPSAPRTITALTDVRQAGAVLRDNYYGWFEKKAAEASISFASRALPHLRSTLTSSPPGLLPQAAIAGPPNQDKQF